MRSHPIEDRGRSGLGASLIAIALPALAWGLFAHSAWVAVATLVLSGLPPVWFRASRLPFLPWLGYGLLAGGTMAATALLTGHARVP